MRQLNCILLCYFVLQIARPISGRDVKHIEVSSKNYNIKIKGSWEVEDKDHPRYKREELGILEENLGVGKKSSCIDRSDLTEVHGRRDQKALVIDLSGTAVLPCHFCGTPEVDTRRSMLWYRFKNRKDASGKESVWQAEEVKLDTHDNENLNRVYTSIDHNLIIKDFQPQDIGTYFCVLYQEGINAITHYSFKSKHIDSTSAASMSAAWKELIGVRTIDFLFHLDIELPMKAKLVTSNGYDYPKPEPPLVSKKNNWYAFTEWEDWGECNVCGMPGEKRRRGHCMVRLIDGKREVQPPFLDHVLRFFIHGAPCHSSLFFNFADVIKRQHETEVEKCSIDCPGSDIDVPDVLDVGKVQINSSLPNVKKKEFPTTTVSSVLGKPVNMTCPLDNSTISYKTEDDQYEPIRWQNGSYVLLTLSANRKKTRHRVQINQVNVLNITRVTKYDNNTYSCWKGHTEIKRYKLVITDAVDVQEKNIWPYFNYLVISYAVDFIIFIIIAALNYRKKEGQVRRTSRKKPSN